MNEPPLPEDWLDARLREEAPYIDDAGFTSRVMKQLPARGSLRTQRAIIIFLAAIFSVVLAYFASGEGWFVRQAVARALTLSPLLVLGSAAACGLLLSAAGLWAALVRERGRAT
ncbi:MAG: hypothetical protein QOH24_2443 [Verrucomicrobiota bacterium]|jgi:hypothetical protein